MFEGFTHCFIREMPYKHLWKTTKCRKMSVIFKNYLTGLCLVIGLLKNVSLFNIQSLRTVG